MENKQNIKKIHVWPAKPRQINPIGCNHQIRLVVARGRAQAVGAAGTHPRRSHFCPRSPCPTARGQGRGRRRRCRSAAERRARWPCRHQLSAGARCSHFARGGPRRHGRRCAVWVSWRFCRWRLLVPHCFVLFVESCKRVKRRLQVPRLTIRQLAQPENDVTRTSTYSNGYSLPFFFRMGYKRSVRMFEKA